MISPLHAVGTRPLRSGATSRIEVPATRAEAVSINMQRRLERDMLIYVKGNC
jgi:hypothetical protein